MKTIRLILILWIKILFITEVTAQKEKVVYTPKLPQVALSVAKTNLTRAIKTAYFPNAENNYWYKPEEVYVLNDRVVLLFKAPKKPVIIYFCDLQKYKLEAIMYQKQDKSWGCDLRLGDLILSIYKDKVYEWELLDYLYYFQQLNLKPLNEQLTLFEPIAVQYRTLKTKPSVTEEQRKYIVQANVMNQQKMYLKAIELYDKVLEVNQTAYPSAYSNLALLTAQVFDYPTAIFYMKKYLMLEPEASDARSCQDKIYEWEILMQN